MQNTEKIAEARRLCQLGFNTHSAEYYDQIDKLLSEVKQTKAVQAARRLCAAGPTLASPRFAYPHIESALNG